MSYLPTSSPKRWVPDQHLALVYPKALRTHRRVSRHQHVVSDQRYAVSMRTPAKAVPLMLARSAKPSWHSLGTIATQAGRKPWGGVSSERPQIIVESDEAPASTVVYVVIDRAPAFPWQWMRRFLQCSREKVDGLRSYECKLFRFLVNTILGLVVALIGLSLLYWVLL